MLESVGRVYRRGGLSGLLGRACERSLAGVVPVVRRGAAFLFAGADQLARGAAAVALSRAERRLLAENRALQHRHQGQRCFVIGNGPSLMEQDLSPLAREITFVMSAFWKHPAVDHWQPTYYCLYDPVFFDRSEVMQAFFANLRARVSDTTFLVPLYARQVIVEEGLLPLSRTYFVAGTGPLCHGWIGQADLTRITDSPQVVSQLALLAAMFMGCSPIYLLGMDHDHLNYTGYTPHFYEGLAGLERHPDVRPIEEWSYKFLLGCQMRLWNGYEVIRRLAERQGIRVLNATRGGFLDVFERVRYEDVMAATDHTAAVHRAR